MKDIELPPLPDLLEKAIVHFAQACLYSEAESRRASAEHLKSEVKAYARAAVEANSVPDGFVLVDRAALQMVIGALRRDAEAGRAVRGEMADMLSASPAPAQQEPSIPAEFDVRTILLSISPGEDGMGHEVYAESVADVEGLLTSMGQELEEWQLGIRLLPTAQHQEPPQPVERKPMTTSQREAAFELAIAAMEVDINLSWRNAIVEAVERHHGIKE